jgi:hypothetical protein
MQGHNWDSSQWGKPGNFVQVNQTERHTTPNRLTSRMGIGMILFRKQNQRR